MTTVSSKQVRQVLPFDGNGYVNNRGSSKYWGVSRTSPQCVTHDWRIRTFTGNPQLNEPNIHLTSSTVLSEEQAAWIASYFYENPNYTLPVVIQAKNGIGEYRIGGDHNVSYHAVPITKSPIVQKLRNTPQLEDKVTEEEPKFKMHVVGSTDKAPQGIAAQAQAILDSMYEGTNGETITESEIDMLHELIDLIENQPQLSNRFKAMATALINS